MAEIVVNWDETGLRMLAQHGSVAAAVDRLAAGAVSTMKFLCPVSPVGPLHRSGNLRSSIHAFRQADGDVVIGPTADYAQYVNDGTYPHLIVSHGAWPLRNRERGQVFGRVVHHPGTVGTHFIERTAESLNGRREHV